MANGTMNLDNHGRTYIAVETVIGITSVLGNIMVIWAVKMNPGLRNTTYYFIVSLAFADLAVGVLVMPLSIILSLGLQLHFYACLFMCCLVLILTNASILSLLAIAIDRYLRIKMPIRYKSMITSRQIYLSIWCVWIMSFLMGLVPMFGWNNRSKGGQTNYLDCKFASVMSMDYMVYFNTIGWVFLPLLIMLTLYIEIFYLIRKQCKQNALNSVNSIFYSKEYRTAKSLALVLLIFALSWLPLSILNCLSFFIPAVEESSAFQHILSFSILLSHGNSAMNPIIYAFKIQKFKDTYIRIIKTYILHRVVLTESGSGEHTLDDICQQ